MKIMNILYTFEGEVIVGKKRGRTLGYPTINVSLEEKIPSGIYASAVLFNNRRLHAATFIGEAKTFDEKDYKAESYILDFDEDIYGELVTIELYKKLRDNEKFTTTEYLIEQIKKDVLETRLFFSNS